MYNDGNYFLEIYPFFLLLKNDNIFQTKTCWPSVMHHK